MSEGSLNSKLLTAEELVPQYTLLNRSDIIVESADGLLFTLSSLVASLAYRSIRHQVC